MSDNRDIVELWNFLHIIKASCFSPSQAPVWPDPPPAQLLLSPTMLLPLQALCLVSLRRDPPLTHLTLCPFILPWVLTISFPSTKWIFHPLVPPYLWLLSPGCPQIHNRESPVTCQSVTVLDSSPGAVLSSQSTWVFSGVGAPILHYCLCCSTERKWKVKAKSFSRVWLFGTPWTVAYQVPLSMEFSRQEYWSGLPFPSPGVLPDPGIEPRFPTLQADALPSESPGKL